MSLVEAIEVEDDEYETPEEKATYAREVAIQKAVKLFCEREIGWDMDRNYCVMFEANENLLTITPNEYEATVEQFAKLNAFGEVTVSCASKGVFHITIKTPPGFNLQSSSRA